MQAALWLNVFKDFDPIIPQRIRKARFICLGNIDPVLQIKVLDQMEDPHFIVCDTMNYWIEGKRDDLLKLLKRVNVLIINDSEARLLANEPNLIKAVKSLFSNVEPAISSAWINIVRVLY